MDGRIGLGKPKRHGDDVHPVLLASPFDGLGHRIFAFGERERVRVGGNAGDVDFGERSGLHQELGHQASVAERIDAAASINFNINITRFVGGGAARGGDKVNKDPGYDNHAQMSRQDPSGEAYHELEMLVHDAYAICARSFASCKTCPPLSPESLQLVEDEASRFDVWAANTGSCRDPSLSSSLDHRLRNSPSTQEMVVLLLRAVRVNLDYGMRITSL